MLKYNVTRRTEHGNLNISYSHNELLSLVPNYFIFFLTKSGEFFNQMHEGNTQPSMSGWARMEIHKVGEPRNGILFKERWFELIDTKLFHYTSQRREDEAAYPGDFINLNDVTTAITLSMRMVLNNQIVVIIHTADPSEWLSAFMKIEFVVGKTKTIKQFMEVTDYSCSHQIKFEDLLLDKKKIIQSSFGCVRKTIIDKNKRELSVRIIHSNSLVPWSTSGSERSTVTELEFTQVSFNKIAELSEQCLFLNSVHIIASTDHDAALYTQESDCWIISDYIPKELEGRCGEPRARVQIAQIVSGLVFLQDNGISIPSNFLHPGKIRLDEMNNAIITSFGYGTVYTDIRRSCSSLSPYYQRYVNDEVTESDNQFWYSVGAVLYYLLSGSSPVFSNVTAVENDNLSDSDSSSDSGLRMSDAGTDSSEEKLKKEIIKKSKQNLVNKTSLVFPPYLSYSSCDLMEKLMTGVVVNMSMFRDHIFFEDFDWTSLKVGDDNDRHVVVPEKVSPPNVFTVVDLQRCSSQANQENRAGSLPQGPSALKPIRESRSVSISRRKPTIERTGLNRQTVASYGRKVETMAKALAIKKKESFETNGLMRHTSRSIQNKTRQPGKGYACVPRNCAVDIVSSTRLHSLLHIGSEHVLRSRTKTPPPTRRPRTNSRPIKQKSNHCDFVQLPVNNHRVNIQQSHVPSSESFRIERPPTNPYN